MSTVLLCDGCDAIIKEGKPNLRVSLFDHLVTNATGLHSTVELDFHDYGCAAKWFTGQPGKKK